MFSRQTTIISVPGFNVVQATLQISSLPRHVQGSILRCCQAPGKEDRRTLTSLLHLSAEFHKRLERHVCSLFSTLERHFQRKKAVKYLQKSLRVVGCLAEDQDTKSTADVLHELGKMCLVTKDFEEAVRYLEEALCMKRSLHDDQDTASVAKTLNLLGQATVHKQADALHELGKTHLVTKDFEEAVRYLEEALRMKRSVYELYGDQDRSSIAKTLDLLARARFHSMDRWLMGLSWMGMFVSANVLRRPLSMMRLSGMGISLMGMFVSINAIREPLLRFQ